MDIVGIGNQELVVQQGAVTNNPKYYPQFVTVFADDDITLTAYQVAQIMYVAWVHFFIGETPEVTMPDAVDLEPELLGLLDGGPLFQSTVPLGQTWDFDITLATTGNFTLLPGAGGSVVGSSTFSGNQTKRARLIWGTSGAGTYTVSIS